MTLQEIIDQLRLCGYECEAGLLENNVAFQELERLAKEDGQYFIHIPSRFDTEPGQNRPGYKELNELREILTQDLPEEPGRVEQDIDIPRCVKRIIDGLKSRIWELESEPGEAERIQGILVFHDTSIADWQKWIESQESFDPIWNSVKVEFFPGRKDNILTGEQIFNQLKKSQRWGANNQPSIYLVTAVLEQLPLRYLSVTLDRIQFSVSRDLTPLELWSLDKLTPDVVRRDGWDFDLWWD